MIRKHTNWIATALAQVLVLGCGLLEAGDVATASGRPSNFERPPNIVYIMADELGYYELSGQGHPHLRTPNLDRMAAEGIRFTQALAGSSLCAPTRCTLMTGKHSGHTSVRTNGGGTPLRAGEETVASVLKRAGYVTGGFGKWGCGGRGSTGVPEEHGFDVFFGYYDQVHAHTYYPAYLIRNSEEVPLAGNKGGRQGETYSHAVIVEEAREFIRSHKDEPFFCYMPVTPPHGLFDIPESDPSWARFRDEPWPVEAKRYAAMVHMLDRNVGEVLALLKELEIEDDTIVFFCGDNGGVDYFKSEAHPRGFHAPNVNPITGVTFRGQKGNLYEGGLRIPMIVRWPGRIEPKGVTDHLCYFPDILPTLAELAGCEAPPDIDGLSMLPTLLGEGEQEQHDHLYWELGGRRAVRRASWKAVRPGPEAGWELYDLRADPEERRDRAAENRELLAELVALAEAAHEPAIEGVFHDRTLHERDRRAKGMGMKRGAVNAMPADGLIPRESWTVLKVSSESIFNGKLAGNAFDGDPRTFWHSRWRGGALKHPHELVIDMGREWEVRGFRYLARQDGGHNGTLAECDFFVSNSVTDFGEPIRARFEKRKTSQEASCSPVRGRYLRLVTVSAHEDGPWVSVAELGAIGGE